MFFRTEVGAQALKQVVTLTSSTDHRLHAKPMGKEVLGRIKSTKLSKLGEVIYFIYYVIYNNIFFSLFFVQNTLKSIKMNLKST